MKGGNEGPLKMDRNPLEGGKRSMEGKTGNCTEDDQSEPKLVLTCAGAGVGALKKRGGAKENRAERRSPVGKRSLDRNAGDTDGCQFIGACEGGGFRLREGEVGHGSIS